MSLLKQITQYVLPKGHVLQKKDYYNAKDLFMLEFKHVSYETPDHKEIIRDVSLQIDDRFVAITGPNGSGKSTMAKLVAGIYVPTSGQILLDGEDITNLSITERAKRGVSFAFQQPVRFKGITVKNQFFVNIFF